MIDNIVSKNIHPLFVKQVVRKQRRPYKDKRGHKADLFKKSFGEELSLVLEQGVVEAGLIEDREQKQVV
jgi:hypothetical protein